MNFVAGKPLSAATAALALAIAVAIPGAGRTFAGDAGLVPVNPSSHYPEGPVVVGDALYYAEMGSDRVMRWDGVANTQIWTSAGCWPTSVATAPAGTLTVLCHRLGRVAVIRPTGETVSIIDRDFDGNPFVTPNASIADGKGGVYFSSSGDFAPLADATGAVLYLDSLGRLRRVTEGIHYANGVALSPDGAHLYVSEHLSRRVLLYDVAADGMLSGKRVFIALDDLVGADPARNWDVGPDGLATDNAGNLFVAEYGGGRILIVSPAGKLLGTIPVPETYVTAMAFTADQSTLFVTAPAARSPAVPGKVYRLANPLRHPG